MSIRITMMSVMSSSPGKSLPKSQKENGNLKMFLLTQKNIYLHHPHQVLELVCMSFPGSQYDSDTDEALFFGWSLSASKLRGLWISALRILTSQKCPFWEPRPLLYRFKTPPLKGPRILRVMELIARKVPKFGSKKMCVKRLRWNQ